MSKVVVDLKPMIKEVTQRHQSLFDVKCDSVEFINIYGTHVTCNEKSLMKFIVGVGDMINILLFMKVFSDWIEYFKKYLPKQHWSFESENEDEAIVLAFKNNIKANKAAGRFIC